MQPEDVQRPPRSGDWHGFLPEEIPEGQTRVIVNLNTFEYINSAKFGQAPTLAGMATLAPKDRDLPILKKANQDHLQIVDVAGGLFVMLCHPERRGGGDIPANGNILIAAVGARDSRAKAAKLFKGVEDVTLNPSVGSMAGVPRDALTGPPPTAAVRPRSNTPGIRPTLSLDVP